MNEKIYEYCKNFAKNIKIERLANKMTQKQVASAIGITTQSYQSYEANQSFPTVANLLKLCILFNTSIDELFEIEKYHN